jgi:hypothetical protein
MRLPLLEDALAVSYPLTYSVASFLVARLCGFWKGVDHVGHDKSPGVEIDFRAEACRVRSEGATKGLVKPYLKIDRAVSTMRYL